MVGKTVAERKAAERLRRDAQGLKRFELWLHPQDWPVVQKLVQRLVKRRGATKR